jgi:aryl-alcohol dehydrogenase-like predicted oxidoreductase
MHIQQLGDTDLKLTRIGLGTWAIGGGNWKFGWGPQDDGDSIRAIHRALDQGINWIDTAPAYGLGHCEEVVGRALSEMAQRPIIATKCGRCWDEQRQLFPRIKRESILAEAEASLRRLKVDTIDLYQIHWPQPGEDIEEAWEAVNALIQSGKVRFGGVSNFNRDQLARIQPIAPVASLQPPYSMLVRGIEAEILPYCAQHHIGVIVYSPMQKGLLTGKVTQQWVDALASDDHRRNDPQFQQPRLSANLKLVEQLKAIAAGSGHTVAQLAIAWTLRRPEVTAAIVGARRPDQVDELVGAGDWQLSPEELQAIDSALTQL